MLAAAALAIVAQDHSALRAAPRATATELTALWQGDVVELRGERAGYLKVYDYRRERGGYVRSESLRPLGLEAADAPGLLSVLRFLRDSSGAESLGISYGAAYLKAVPAEQLSAEPFDAIARMAERLADQASGQGSPLVAAHLEVVEQFGVRMKSFERGGRVQFCYDGELYRRVLASPAATAEARARAALALTRADCIDPALLPRARAALEEQRRQILEQVDDRGLNPLLRSRLHARRATLWAALAFEQARHGASPAVAAERALGELADVRAEDLGADRRGEYLEARVRVGAVRWGALNPAAQTAPLSVTATAGEPGQTCVTLADMRGRAPPVLVRRCTYGVVWLASAQSVAQGRALVLAVQPLPSWRELWVFHAQPEGWALDVLSPGPESPELGYVEFAGFVPATRRLLVAREVRGRAGFARRFEELQLDDLALVKQASAPELLADFGRWQDVTWRRDTLSLH